MKSYRRAGLYTSSSSFAAAGTVTVTATTNTTTTATVDSTEIPVTVHLSNRESNAAVKIQSAYRSHVIRKLTNKIKVVNSEADQLQRLIQLQETVDAVRTNDRDRIKMNEALMKLLFTLDSVPGVYPTVRELRRNVSRRIVGLQEILDSICEAKEGNCDGYLKEWDDLLGGIEREICRQKGGADSHEFERFCAENLGFQCLQRFLRQ